MSGDRILARRSRVVNVGWQTAGKALFQMLGVFAEFERSMIVGRVKSGLRRAGALGKRLGRPRVAPAVEGKIRKLLGQGVGVKKTAMTVGIGVATVQKIKAAS